MRFSEIPPVHHPAAAIGSMGVLDPEWDECPECGGQVRYRTSHDRDGTAVPDMASCLFCEYEWSG